MAGVIETIKEKLSGVIAGDDWAPPTLKANILNEDELALAKMLHTQEQDHLFEHWPAAGEQNVEKHRFFEQVSKLDSSYPGGLKQYISNARKLLADSRDGKNPFDGFTPTVPTGEKLVFGDESFMKFEERGIKEAQHSAFVLVAGGLGERLGYSGIKVALPSETTTGKFFLQLYIESILALQEASHVANPGGEKSSIPLAIMTSDDTDGRTRELLESANYFGMSKEQVILLKQEKVACLADNNATLAPDPKDPFVIQTKPHGHGDVHVLLHQGGLLGEWQTQRQSPFPLHSGDQERTAWYKLSGDRYKGCRLQAVPASLGVSAVRDFDVNSLAVPRKGKESIGAIARLAHTDGSAMVINVEYNQLDPLLRATTFPEGDVNDELGFSPFPGNLNQLVLKLKPYVEELNRTNGMITEFVNPKYKDSSKTVFKSSTRLECMMQDYPKTLSASAKVGFTVCDVWLGYSPVKNNAVDAAAKLASGTPAHSGTSGEMDIYRANCLILQKAGAEIAEPTQLEYNKQTVEVYPRIVWSSSWALTFAQVKAKVQKLSVSQKSTLILEGANITLKDVNVDGALVIKAAPGAKVVVSGLKVENKGWLLEAIDCTDESIPEEIRVRGFKVIKEDSKNIEATEGEKVVSE